MAGGHREICSSGFPETVTQAVTSKAYMGGLGVLPSFGLADLRKKSKPMCTESGNPGSRSEWGLWFGTHGSKFLDGAFDLLPIESLK